MFGHAVNIFAQTVPVFNGKTQSKHASIHRDPGGRGSSTGSVRSARSRFPVQNRISKTERVLSPIWLLLPVDDVYRRTPWRNVKCSAAQFKFSRGPSIFNEKSCLKFTRVLMASSGAESSGVTTQRVAYILMTSRHLSGFRAGEV